MSLVSKLLCEARRINSDKSLSIAESFANFGIASHRPIRDVTRMEKRFPFLCTSYASKFVLAQRHKVQMPLHSSLVRVQVSPSSTKRTPTFLHSTFTTEYIVHDFLSHSQIRA